MGTIGSGVSGKEGERGREEERERYHGKHRLRYIWEGRRGREGEEWQREREGEREIAEQTPSSWRQTLCGRTQTWKIVAGPHSLSIRRFYLLRKGGPIKFDQPAPPLPLERANKEKRGSIKGEGNPSNEEEVISQQTTDISQLYFGVKCVFVVCLETV